jgi:hypothetical protein
LIVSDTTPKRVGRPPGQIAVGITPEVEDAFVEGLRMYGTLDAAARHARPHLVARGSKRCSVGTFREHARRHPEFAARVEDALSEYKGVIEATIHERAMTPDERPVFNPKSGELYLCVDHRNANQLLLAIAGRIDPASWAPKKNVSIDATVTHTGSLTSGAQFVVKPDDILLLSDPAEQRLLIDLLVKIESARKSQEALPEPVKPYGNWNASPAPALEDQTNDGK